jgi:hypothetical protein
MTLFIILSLIGAFGWGMYAQEILQKRALKKERERRIIVDAPFSLEQSETIMRVLQNLNDFVSKTAERIEKDNAVRHKIWDVVGECGTDITDKQKISEIELILLDSEEL